MLGVIVTTYELSGLTIQASAALSVADVAAFALPLAPAQVFVGLAKLFAQGLAQGRIGGESIEGLAEVDRQPAAAAGIQGLGVVVVVAAGARS